MKNIILSADSAWVVYSVPDPVADHLREYCAQFERWLRTSPKAKKYRMGDGVCYDESDFIDYLNTHVFPEQPSVPVDNLGWPDAGGKIPPQYENCPQIHF